MEKSQSKSAKESAKEKRRGAKSFDVVDDDGAFFSFMRAMFSFFCFVFLRPVPDAEIASRSTIDHERAN